MLFQHMSRQEVSVKELSDIRSQSEDGVSFNETLHAYSARGNISPMFLILSSISNSTPILSLSLRQPHIARALSVTAA
jgi:hypothetical protein